MKQNGEDVNPKRVYRLWRKEGLSLPRRRPRKQVRTPSLRPLASKQAGEVWAVDFVFDKRSHATARINRSVGTKRFGITLFIAEGPDTERLYQKHE